MVVSMKMPGAQRLKVQSLGRESESLTYDAESAESTVIVTALDTVSDAVSEVKKKIVDPAYKREAVAQLSDAEGTRALTMAEAEATLNNPKGVVHVSQIPNGVTYKTHEKGVKREYIPTHEVAKDWYKKKLETSQAAAIKDMTNASAIRKMKEDSDKAYAREYASVLMQADIRKQKSELGKMNKAVEQNIEAGRQKEAEVMLLGAMETGVLDEVVGTERLMAIPGKMDAYKISKAVTNGTLSDMPIILDYIYRDYNMNAAGEILTNDDGTLQQNPLSFDQRKTLVKEVESQTTKLTASVKKVKDYDSSRALNEQLIFLEDQGIPFTTEEVSALAPTMNPEDHRVLVVANRAKQNSTTTFKSEDRALGTVQMMINDLMLPSTEGSINVRRSRVTAKINQLMEDEKLTSDDAWKLITRINAAQSMVFNTPDMTLVVDQIYKRLTQGSKSSVGLNNSSQSVINAANAERDLFDAAMNHGPSFDALGWYDKNIPKYVTKQLYKASTKLTKSLSSVYIVRNDQFLMDVAATRKKLAEGIAAGQVTNEVELEIHRQIGVFESSTAGIEFKQQQK